MRILPLVYSFTVVFFIGFQGKSQGFTGKVKNDSAFIEVPGSSGLQLIPVSDLLKKEACEGCEPVYHFVGKSEGLYRIGKWYGNQPVTVIKKLNGLRSDALSPGQKLLVGYIPSPLIQGTNTVTSIPVPTSRDTVSSPSESRMGEEVKDHSNPPPPKKILSYSGEGVFAGEFKPEAGTVVKKSGMASFFKSESGWADGRFYLLNSSLKTGLVVKITNPATGTFLYAKVIGPLPDIKQNQGLSLRLNSAAAALLGFWEEEKSFELTWEY